MNDPENIFRFNKRISLAALITAIVVVGGLGGLLTYKATKPTVSTIYYHYNLQYRCGDGTSYEDISFAVINIVWMYGNHTNWNYSIECQFMLLEYINDNHADWFADIKEQNERGQLELITPQYSDGWHVPYPLKDFYESVNYTQHRMAELGLTASNLIVLQEGQWLPGFTQLRDMGNFDAFVLHIEQATYWKYYPDKPILKWDFGGYESHALVNPRAPVFEANTWHHQIYAADGELLNTGDVEVHGGPASEFAFNPEKQKNHEDKLIALEKKGNRFMTMGQFYDFAVQNEKNIGTLDKFLPECEWVAAQYNQYFTWMGNGKSHSDDGSLIARYYNTRNIIQATELLINQAYEKGYISEQNYSDWGPYKIGTSEGLLLEAKKHIWESQVSDTTGISPSYWEFWYGLNNSQDAVDLCYDVIDNVRNELTGNPYEPKIQVNPYTKDITNNSAEFYNNTLVDASISLSDIESKFGFDVEVSQSAAFNSYGFTEEYGKYYYNTTDWDVEYYKMKYGFYGAYNYTFDLYELNYLTENELKTYNTTGDPSTRNDISVKFTDDWTQATYSPALAENETVTLTRDDYWYEPYGIGEEWYCLLSLCNGLLYNPQEGYAIVKNCSSCHMAANWRNTNVEFFETEQKYNSTREFFIVEGSLSDILQFANQINSYALFQWEAI
ncbi:MAG: hypothetical protein GF364_17765 [Candidatus Lokiarchaeota archaeon]|nr:hypothetical protein [Candidatus Lokiarchaeota archaeon]